MKEIDKIDIEYIKKIFTESSTVKEVIEKFGKKPNGSGFRFYKSLVEKANINVDDYIFHISKEKYNLNPKFCLNCGKKLTYSQRNNKFCSHNCSATYNNLQRESIKIERRIKISNTLTNGCCNVDKIKNNFHAEHSIFICENCGKEFKGKKNSDNKFCSLSCRNKYKENENIENWLNGVNKVRGATQIPEFIKKYLFNKFNCKCEKCGWGEKNPITNKIPLTIHHKDGDCTNNLRDNLELLCPNCHSLTENFGSLNKNSKRFHRPKKTLDLQ